MITQFKPFFLSIIAYLPVTCLITAIHLLYVGPRLFFKPLIFKHLLSSPITLRNDRNLRGEKKYPLTLPATNELLFYPINRQTNKQTNKQNSLTVIQQAGSTVCEFKMKSSVLAVDLVYWEVT